MAKSSFSEFATGDGLRAEVAAAPECASGLAARITVEHCLYATIFFAGGLLRFAGLGDWPLSVPEAVHAWSAWQMVQGVHHGLTLLAESAAMQGLLTGLFYLGANDDFWVRSVAAAAGSALILLPWWWREFVGRWSALWLALFFAISPWMVAASRIADGSALAILAFFLALTALQQLVRVQAAEESLPHSRRYWSIIAAAAIGFMLTTGTLAWSLALLLLVFSLIYSEALRAANTWNVSAILAFGVAFLLGATGALLRPDGLGVVVGSLGVWLGRVQGDLDPGFAYLGEKYGPMWPLVRLVVDQPILLLIGVGGLIHLSIRRNPATARWPVVLWAWLACAILLCLLPQRGPQDLFVLLVPLAFGTAQAFASLCNSIPAQQSRRDAIAVFATLVILSVSLVFWAAGVAASREFDAKLAQHSLLTFSLVALILFIYGWWASWTEAYWLGAVTLASWLLLFTVGGAWHLAHRQDLARPDGFMAEVTHPEVRQLVKDMETISALRSGDPHQLAIRVEDAQPAQQAEAESHDRPIAGPHPVLGWYLREFQNSHWGARAGDPSQSQPAALFITLPGARVGDSGSDEGAPAGYMGSDYGLAAAWLPQNLSPSIGSLGVYGGGWEGVAARFRDAWRDEFQPWLRWALYRRVEVQPEVDSVNLWVSPAP